MRGGKSGTTIYNHDTLWLGMYAFALGKSKRIIPESHFVTYFSETSAVIQRGRFAVGVVLYWLATVHGGT
jgi:hypothetical protein